MKKNDKYYKGRLFQFFSEEVMIYLFRIIHFVFGKNSQHLEDKIDLIFYKLSELTYNEIKIVVPEVDKVLASFGLSKAVYEQMCVENLASLDKKIIGDIS